jgi:predicted glycogen debranching enzyme
MVMLSACAEWLVVAGPSGKAPVRHDLSTFAFGPSLAASSNAATTKGASQQAAAPAPETLSPRGIDALHTCAIASTIVWTYELPGLGVRVSRELCLHRLRNACTIRYRVHGTLPAGSYLESRPLFAMRDFHDLVQHASKASMHSEDDGIAVRVRRDGLSCTLHPNARAHTQGGAAAQLARFVASPDVWSNFAYSIDRERGQDGREHLWSPGTFVVPLHAGTHHDAIALDIEARAEADATLASSRALPTIDDHIATERDRLAPMVRAACERASAIDHEPLTHLARAADQFVVVRAATDAPSLASIIAGYPWFSDWGRDTMISLPGLLLSTGRFDEAHASLLAFARLRRRGLVPNCFDNGSGEAMYNTADASLWFLVACVRYLHATKDAKGFAGLLPACFDVVDAYEAGTDFGIRVDKADGLVVAGTRDTQLTWMDAKRDGVVFTPRNGKPVELSALWYGGLTMLASALDDSSPQRARSLRALASHTARHFESSFWSDAQGCLLDLVPGEQGVMLHEASLVRPNQVFATCLPESPLSKAKRALVLERVHEQLLTPYGLRTLAPGSAGYRPFYEGPLFARDGAYHCGTVWPWLLGPYCEGLMRVNAFSSASRTQARELLRPLLADLLGDWTPAAPATLHAASSSSPTRAAAHEQQTRLRLPIRTLAEVYDADDVPGLGRRRAEGCFAQAWSIAETLRVLRLASRGE